MEAITKTRIYSAPADEVFRVLDALGVTGMHMTTSSAALFGGKMNLEFLTPHRTGLHTRYRWTGNVLWWKLDFTVAVTRWIAGKEKVWETTGAARLLIYSWFRMVLQLQPVPSGTQVDLSIQYERPDGFFKKVLFFLFGGLYGRWCLKNMLRDAGRILQGNRHQPSL